MTQEQIEEKVQELSVKHNVSIHPIVFKVEGSDETIVGFIKEPPRFVKLRIMDKAMESPVSAASEIIDAYLIKEESDPRIYSESSENDQYYMGAALTAFSFIKIATNTFKKK